MARQASPYARSAATTGFGSQMADIEKEYSAARAENEKRYAQAMAIYDEIVNRYQPGGAFGKGALAQLETQKVKDVGQQTQQMISSGLYGTTTTAGLPSKWETEVGTPARLKLEDIMMERLSQAQVGKAGFIERREDIYPDVGAVAQYAQQAAAGGGGGGGAGGGRGIGFSASNLTGEGMYGNGHSWSQGSPVSTAVYGKGYGQGGAQYTPTLKPGDFGYEAWLKQKKQVPKSWTPTTPGGISPAAGYYAGIPSGLV